MSELKIMQYTIGEFFIEKFTEKYDEEDFINLPDSEYANELKKTLKKAGCTPYITVGDNIGVWSSTFRVDSNMYQMLDTLETDENDEITDTAIINVIQILCMMNCVIGDSTLMLDKLRIIDDFRKRMEDLAEKNSEKEQ